MGGSHYSRFLPSLNKHSYLIYAECRGRSCGINNKCDICVQWDENQWSIFTKSERVTEFRHFCKWKCKVAKTPERSSSFPDFSEQNLIAYPAFIISSHSQSASLPPVSPEVPSIQLLLLFVCMVFLRCTEPVVIQQRDQQLYVTSEPRRE